MLRMPIAWSGGSIVPDGYLDLRTEALAVATEAEPLALEADESSTLDVEMHDLLRRSGLCEIMVPAEYGGRNESVDPLAVCVVREVLMGVSAHLDSLFALQGIGSYGITVHGTDEQRATWLPQVGACAALAALALTEPVAGSDLRSIATCVDGVGTDMAISGEKAFISNAGVAAFYSTLVREDDGLSMFLVPADRAGITTSPAPEIIAPHVLGSVHFDRVPVTEADRLGGAGLGLEVVLDTLAVFRASVAGASVGLGSAALVEATRHVRSREQFGRPLARLGPVAQLLAESATEVEMARLLAHGAAACASRETLEYSSMAKLGASEAASRVVDRCVQVMGRWGLVRGSKIEKLYRQARPMRIYEGSSEVLRLGIARRLCEDLP